jgi:hypothetical protein
MASFLASLFLLPFLLPNFAARFQLLLLWLMPLTQAGSRYSYDQLWSASQLGEAIVSYNPAMVGYGELWSPRLIVSMVSMVSYGQL